MHARTLALFTQLHAAATDEHGRQGMLRIRSLGVPGMMREVVDESVAVHHEGLSGPEFGDPGRDREQTGCPIQSSAIRATVREQSGCPVQSSAIRRL